MNQHIKNFIEQSTEYILGVPQLNKQQFANLIVAECAKVCETVSNANHNDGQTFARAIKEHFGV